MAETAYRSWKAAVPKKTHNKYRELNDRREDMKKRYQLLPRLEYLKTMGHLLHKITTKISENPVKHTSKKPTLQENDLSKQTLSENSNETVIDKEISVSVDPLHNELSEDEETNDPFVGRNIGQTKKVLMRKQEIEKNRPVFLGKNVLPAILVLTEQVLLSSVHSVISYNM